MHIAIERSCNTYFWATGLITDPAKTTEMVQYLGYGEKFDLPIPAQRFGTMPNPEWLMKKYDRKWQGYDSANTSIGQGYVLVNPMQLAVMPARLASGKLLQPRLLMGGKRHPIADLDVDPESSRDRPRRPWPRWSTAAAPRSDRSFRSTASRWPARPARRRSSGSARAVTRATGPCATMRCSSPSRRPTSRATRSAASSNMAASAPPPRPRSSRIR